MLDSMRFSGAATDPGRNPSEAITQTVRGACVLSVGSYCGGFRSAGRRLGVIEGFAVA